MGYKQRFTETANQSTHHIRTSIPRPFEPSVESRRTCPSPYSAGAHTLLKPVICSHPVLARLSAIEALLTDLTGMRQTRKRQSKKISWVLGVEDESALSQKR